MTGHQYLRGGNRQSSVKGTLPNPFYFVEKKLIYIVLFELLLSNCLHPKEHLVGWGVGDGQLVSLVGRPVLQVGALHHLIVEGQLVIGVPVKNDSTKPHGVDLICCIEAESVGSVKDIILPSSSLVLNLLGREKVIFRGG